MMLKRCSVWILWHCLKLASGRVFGFSLFSVSCPVEGYPVLYAMACPVAWLETGAVACRAAPCLIISPV